jgi:hypothetical protein
MKLARMSVLFALFACVSRTTTGTSTVSYSGALTADFGDILAKWFCHNIHLFCSFVKKNDDDGDNLAEDEEGGPDINPSPPPVAKRITCSVCADPHISTFG